MSIPAEYGLKYVPGLVIEENSNFCVRGYPYCLLPEQVSHTVTSPLQSGYQVILSASHGIQKTDDLRSGLYVNSLLRTSNQSYCKTDFETMQNFSRESKDSDGPFMVGAVAVEQLSVTNKETRIIWYSCSSLLDETINEASSGANFDLIINSISWLCQYDTNVTIHSKVVAKNRLLLTDAQSIFWSIILIVVLPATLLSCCAIICIKRKRI